MPAWRPRDDRWRVFFSFRRFPVRKHPQLIEIVRGQLTVRGQGVLNGRMYQVRTSTDGGKTWTSWDPFNGARLMVLSPTTPGTTYIVELCALGGSTGQSAWSNPGSIMAT